jgi:hypothetical protein
MKRDIDWKGFQENVETYIKKNRGIGAKFLKILFDNYSTKGIKNLNIQKTVKSDLGIISDNTSNLENILGMLHEFRNWNREWDIYFAKHPKNVDEFAKLLSKRYKVKRVNVNYKKSVRSSELRNYQLIQN